MLDKERVLAKIDELGGYRRELDQVKPASREEYKKIEKKRACERLLQLLIECMIDICALLVTGLRLGLPGEEDDLFERLEQAGVISPLMKETLRKMRAFRNILVREYGRIDDQLVYEILQDNLNDFDTFKGEILEAIRNQL
ncbi:MAG: type VII toxin-antitoxin system HepT family RNase toxin [Thermodesulfobacteriota bacterium]